MVVNEISARDYITPSKLGDFAINPYVGCPHACRYSYASFMMRHTNHQEPWGEFTDVKIVEKPISLKRISGKSVVMSSVTDPYNPLEAKYEATRRILEQLIYSNFHLQIITKSKLVTRDIDLLQKMRHVSVAISINTADEKFRQDMDRADSIADRIDVLRMLHEAGIHTVLFMAPIFPFITEWKEIIARTCDFVDYYWLDGLNLRGSYANDIMGYIRTSYPQFYEDYLNIYYRGDKSRLLEFNRAICDWCDSNHINYSAYFQKR
jgi:DNA repair photolyase